MLDPARVSEAMVCWTGWGCKRWPTRDDAAVLERFGEDETLDLLPALRLLEDDFYSSDARQRIANLSEMGDTAAEDFRKLHPEVSEEAVLALRSCYTFDYK
jgi:hypothetical protein